MVDLHLFYTASGTPITMENVYLVASELDALLITTYWNVEELWDHEFDQRRMMSILKMLDVRLTAMLYRARVQNTDGSRIDAVLVAVLRKQAAA